MEAQGGEAAGPDSPGAEIGFGVRLVDGAANLEEPPRGRYTFGGGPIAGLRRRTRRGRRQEAPGLLQGRTKRGAPDVMTDDVEQIAVLPGGGVGPLTRYAGGDQTHPQRAASGAVDVAYRPVPSGAASGGEVLPADLLGALGERRGHGPGVTIERGHRPSLPGPAERRTAGRSGDASSW